MRKLLLFLVFAASFSHLYAQETNVSFKIINQKREGLPFATVSLTSVADSNTLLERTTDSIGAVIFRSVKTGNYQVRVTSVNYTPALKGISVTATDPSFTITLDPGSTSLSTVVVTATRPLMRQEDDKTIVDPESLAASSTNTFEVLEKTPGLFVDQDGNIYLNSMTPASIYINGREQKMSTADVATILKSLPPHSISSIEIMRTPSARYDASGSGGIVNVMLKKGVRIGLTGTTNAGFNQGKYGNRFVGFNINNSNGMHTTYFNVQYSRRNNFEELRTDRIFAADSMLTQDAYTKYPASGFYAGYGIGYQFTRKWDVTYDGRISVNHARNTTTNISGIKSMSNGGFSDRNEARIQNRSNSFNINQGIASKYKIDSLGSEWSVDLSFNYAPNQTEQLFSTFFTTPLSSPFYGDGDLENRFQFFSAQTNLLKKLRGGLTLETGLKSTNVWFHNETEYFRGEGSGRTKDNARSKTYRYQESINAGYGQISKSLSGFILKLGARAENTSMEGKQLLPADTAFSISRTDLFPYMYLSKGLGTIMGFEPRIFLIYRRTISRPGYDLLNPSIRYVDPYLLETGNPSLRPQFTTNYEANVSVDERPILAFGFNRVSDMYTNIIIPADSNSKVSVRTYDNLGTNKETYFRAMGAIPPGGKYFFVLGTQYNHNFYEGLYEKKPLIFKRGTWSVFTYHQLKLTPLTQLTLNGFMRLKGQLQLYELGPFGALNLSLSQQFFKKKLIVNLSLQDAFYTNHNEFAIKQGSVNASGYRKGDTRRVGLNLRYNFGVRKKEENTIDMESQ